MRLGRSAMAQEVDGDDLATGVAQQVDPAVVTPRPRRRRSRIRGSEQPADRSPVRSYEPVERGRSGSTARCGSRSTSSSGASRRAAGPAGSTPTGRTPGPRSGSTSRARRRSDRANGRASSSGSARRSVSRWTTNARSSATAPWPNGGSQRSSRPRCGSRRSVGRRRLRPRVVVVAWNRSGAGASRSNSDGRRPRRRRLTRSQIPSTTTSATRNATASQPT